MAFPTVVGVDVSESLKYALDSVKESVYFRHKLVEVNQFRIVELKEGE